MRNSCGIEAGNHEIMVIAYHVSGHSTNETMDLDITDSVNPVWNPIPTDQSIDEGAAFSYQVNAFDYSGIVGWSVNDTMNFEISATGLITNVTTLAVGDYGLNISVWDPFGNTLFKEITITVLVVTTTTTTMTDTSTTDTATQTDTETLTPPPLDAQTLTIIIIGVGGLIAVIVIIVVHKKRG